MIGDISLHNPGKSFCFSPENPNGKQGGGSQGKPWEKVRAWVEVVPGEIMTIVDTNGPGKIQSIWLTGTVSPHMVLRIYWDHQEHPSVETPLSAFFGFLYSQNLKDMYGNFPGLNSSMVMVAPACGMNCYWPMPFRKHCRITVENRSPNLPHTLFYCITGVRQEVDERALYFHASYRQEHPTKGEASYTIIDGIRGTGHFAGTALFAGINGSNGCWVEGEAMMYIDGDTWPSINYTGTEDYFCGSYAFGYDHKQLNQYIPYSGHYAGMYAVMGDRAQHYQYQPRFMLYRWHIPDPILFSADFRMTLQHMHFTPHGHRPRRDDYASVAYWYQTLPSAPLAPLPHDSEIETE